MQSLQNSHDKVFGLLKLGYLAIEHLDDVILSCQNLADAGLGAIIVFTQNTPLGNYVKTGTVLDARLTSQLLESIFAKNSPLHDGAVILDNSRIQGAGAILPVSDSSLIPSRYGLRHRAAVGLTEKSDAICLVVSEETGQISLVLEGRIERLEAGELKSRLLHVLA